MGTGEIVAALDGRSISFKRQDAGWGRPQKNYAGGRTRQISPRHGVFVLMQRSAFGITRGNVSASGNFSTQRL